ncbi:MAG: SOS response-associated peptidase [Alphaproteobacteria bacterium]|nr:SOS response-associated peptidase [Alphaproteobacteria bacterium]
MVFLLTPPTFGAMIAGMCGRFSLTTPVESVRRLFGFAEIPNLPARYNIAPTQAVLAVGPSRTAPPRRSAGGGARESRSAFFLRWGLAPSWSKDPAAGSGLINARAETVQEKPSFRAAFRRRRCLIPADGFYEWKKVDGGPKQPYRIGFADSDVFAFAGLWESWMGPDGSEIDTGAIVTTEAAPSIADIHHRMPVILEPDAFDPWLHGDAAQAAALMGPYSGARTLVATPISTRVNSVRNDGPDLWKPVDVEAGQDAAAPDPGVKTAGQDQLTLF